MPNCPVCGNYYTEGDAKCRECGEELERLEEQTCENCDGRVRAKDFFCSHCGVILEPGEGEIECEEHPKQDAVGVCVVCGKPVCSDCERKKGNTIFCKTTEHMKIHRQWSAVFTTKNEYEAEMIRTNLENAGFPSKVFSQHDYLSFAMNNKLAIVKVMVQRTQASDARGILRELNLLDDEGRVL
ncbi:MAG: DUF2007 domain-containing protein [Bacteroidota bacterium]